MAAAPESPNLAVGEIVWAKVPGFAWWPAQIWTPDPDGTADDAKRGVVVVFLDDGSWTNVSPKSIVDFVDEYEKKLKSCMPTDKVTKERFLQAVVKGRQLTEMTGWVQCDGCAKWRKFPATVPSVAEKWKCSNNTWDKYRSCSMAEECSSPPKKKTKTKKKKKKTNKKCQPANRAATSGGAATKQPGQPSKWGGLAIDFTSAADSFASTVRITRDFPPAVVLADFVALACRKPIETVAKLAFVVQHTMRAGTVRQVEGAAVVDAPYMGQIRKLLPADVQQSLHERGDEVSLFNAIFDHEAVRKTAKSAKAEWVTAWPEIHMGPPKPRCKCAYCTSCAEQASRSAEEASSPQGKRRVKRKQTSSGTTRVESKPASDDQAPPKPADASQDLTNQAVPAIKRRRARGGQAAKTDPGADPSDAADSCPGDELLQNVEQEEDGSRGSAAAAYDSQGKMEQQERNAGPSKPEQSQQQQRVSTQEAAPVQMRHVPGEQLHQLSVHSSSDTQAEAAQETQQFHSHNSTRDGSVSGGYTKVEQLQKQVIDSSLLHLRLLLSSEDSVVPPVDTAVSHESVHLVPQEAWSQPTAGRPTAKAMDVSNMLAPAQPTQMPNQRPILSPGDIPFAQPLGRQAQHWPVDQRVQQHTSSQTQWSRPADAGLASSIHTDIWAASNIHNLYSSRANLSSNQMSAPAPHMPVAPGLQQLAATQRSAGDGGLGSAGHRWQVGSAISHSTEVAPLPSPMNASAAANFLVTSPPGRQSQCGVAGGNSAPTSRPSAVAADVWPMHALDQLGAAALCGMDRSRSQHNEQPLQQYESQQQQQQQQQQLQQFQSQLQQQLQQQGQQGQLPPPPQLNWQQEQHRMEQEQKQRQKQQEQQQQRRRRRLQIKQMQQQQDEMQRQHEAEERQLDMACQQKPEQLEYYSQASGAYDSCGLKSHAVRERPGQPPGQGTYMVSSQANCEVAGVGGPGTWQPMGGDGRTAGDGQKCAQCHCFFPTKNATHLQEGWMAQEGEVWCCATCEMKATGNWHNRHVSAGLSQSDLLAAAAPDPTPPVFRQLSAEGHKAADNAQKRDSNESPLEAINKIAEQARAIFGTASKPPVAGNGKPPTEKRIYKTYGIKVARTPRPKKGAKGAKGGGVGGGGEGRGGGKGGGGVGIDRTPSGGRPGI